MRIVGIDPGLSSTGVGAIESTDDGWRLLASDEARSTPKEPLPARLARLHAMVAAFLEAHRPDAVAVESLFFAKNVRSAVMMAHGRGVAILAAASSGVPLVEYAPREIKLAVAGYGQADKEQVARMVALHLGLAKPPGSEHQADALAAALTHGFRQRGGLAKAVRRAAEETSENPAKALLAQAFGRRRRR